MAPAAVVGVLCVVGAFVVGYRYERVYLRVVVQRSRQRPGRGAAVACGMQFVAALVDICLGAVAHATGNEAVALTSAAPVLIAHGALVLVALPSSDVIPYYRGRRDLAVAGASAATARAIAWAAGVGALLFGPLTLMGTWLLAVSAGSHTGSG